MAATVAPFTDPSQAAYQAVKNKVVGQLGEAGTALNGTAAPFVKGAQSLTGPTSQTQPEATAPLAPAPAPPAEGGRAPQVQTAGTPDPTDAHATVASWMTGNNPQGHQDAAYWERRIAETGGLRPDNMAYWQGRFLEAPGTHVENGGGGGGGGSTDPNISAFYAAQTAQLAQQQERQAQTRQIIMERLARAGQPVDENSASIRAPLSAARDEVQRSSERERTAMAERMYASGQLNSGAMNQYIQQSAEKGASSLSNLRANLITHETDQKRAELQNLLQMATASGDSEQARSIQAQIAALNATVASQGQGNQLAMFGANLNQQAALSGLNG
jgi:hypothetical protein